nr:MULTISPECIES: translocation/assembly module TamB domain-containing protein [unclassified Nannocystis]
MVELDGLGIEAIDVDQGVIEIQRCSEADPCPANKDGFGVFVGGRTAAIDDLAAPEGHLRARVGDRGSLALWGNVVLAPDFSRLESSSLRVDVDDVQYKMFDNSGRPQLYAAISGKGIVLEGRDVQTLRGDVQVARGRWVRDAQQGVKVLSFADPTSAPSAPPPEILRDMNLDLRLRTTTPFRVDNNIMKGVEGSVSLAIGGTIADLEMSGRVDVTAGVLDVAILNGAYDITYGRVLLENNLSSSKVDVRAQRQEPVYIDNQPRQMSLILGGTLDAITFRCSVLGDTRARSRTQRECVDYAILGSGNREVADANVRRYGSGGLLGRPLGLVGNLTEINLNRYVEKSVPRLAPYLPQVGAQLGQLGVEVNAETPRPWFRTDWGNLTIGAGYTRGYPGLLLRNSYDWRVRFRLLDSAVLEFRDNRRSYFNERIIFDPLRQRSLELRLEYQLPSLR